MFEWPSPIRSSSISRASPAGARRGSARGSRGRSAAAARAAAASSCVATMSLAPPRPLATARAASISARCSTFARSSGSSLGSAANQASRISRSSGSEVARRLSASTFASFQARAPRAVSASAQSAARTPAHLVCRDRGAGTGPAADDSLVRPALGDVARRPLAGPRPVAALALRQGAVSIVSCPRVRSSSTSAAGRACPCRLRPRLSWGGRLNEGRPPQGGLSRLQVSARRPARYNGRPPQGGALATLGVRRRRPDIQRRVEFKRSGEAIGRLFCYPSAPVPPEQPSDEQRPPASPKPPSARTRLASATSATTASRLSRGA